MNRLLSMPMHLLQRMPILIGTMAIVGGLLGGAVVPLVQGALEAFDSANPVLVVRARVVSADADEIVVQLAGEKRRECQYIGLQAYTRAKGGTTLTDAYIRRVDMPENGSSRPTGAFSNFGTWRIWPRGDAGVVLVYAQHSCSGRLVITRVADILLDKAAPPKT